jgi:hypothetical protein
VYANAIRLWRWPPDTAPGLLSSATSFCWFALLWSGVLPWEGLRSALVHPDRTQQCEWGLRCSFYIGDGQNNQLEINLPCVTCPVSTLDLLSSPWTPLEICALPPINSCRLVSWTMV